MAQSNYDLDDVFGMSRDIPKNYVSREYVDEELETNILRDKHIVIYGSSKQGKTCLRKKCIDEDNQIVIQCNNRWSLEEIHSAILKKAGYKITRSEKKSISGTQKIVAKLRTGLFDGGSESQISMRRERVEEGLELDPEDVNDIIEALDGIGFDKHIVLEDFHYLPEVTQTDFAVALKAFHEASYLNFIVVGVWLEENRLIVKNGDLTGRVISVNADRWKEEELREVIQKGEDLLNISFDDNFRDEVIENCFNSVYMVQEACQIACAKDRTLSTQSEETVVGESLSGEEAIGEVIDTQRARYRSFLENFSSGFQQTELEMYRWLLYPILTASPEELEDGLVYRHLRENIESQHPQGNGLNPGNLTQSLKSTTSLQADLDIKPFILDYDETNKRLSIVDRGFLIWLQTEETDDLLEYAGLSQYIE